MESLETARLIAETIAEKLGEEITILRISKQTTLADYFVIASATSTTHLRSLCDEVEFRLSKAGLNPSRIEGVEGSAWILMDYDSVIVHLFLKDSRSFYALERLWADAEHVEFDEE